MHLIQKKKKPQTNTNIAPRNLINLLKHKHIHKHKIYFKQVKEIDNFLE